MKIIKKIFKNRFVKTQKRGQAVIEYTLLLVIGVSIAYGLKDQFMEPFKHYTEELFDGYYVCLMESAVLPGMNTSCSAPDFSAGSSSGFNPGGSGGGSSGGGNNTPNSSQPESSSDPSSESYWNSPSSSKKTPLASSSGLGSGGGGENSFPARAASRNSGGSSTSSSSSGSSFPIKSNSSKNMSSLDSSLSQSSRIDSQSSRSFKVSKKQTSKLTSGQVSASQGSSSRFITSTGETTQQKKAQERGVSRGGPIPAGASNASSQGEIQKREKLILKEKTKPRVTKKPDSSFNFGKWMKYILIAVLIGVILFFVGSQAVQMRENLKAS